MKLVFQHVVVGFIPSSVEYVSSVVIGYAGWGWMMGGRRDGLDVLSLSLSLSLSPPFKSWLGFLINTIDA